MLDAGHVHDLDASFDVIGQVVDVALVLGAVDEILAQAVLDPLEVFIEGFFEV